MSDKIGARAFYIMLDAIKDTLLNDQDINTVTYGDLSEVDLGKQTIFPLAHIVINGAQNTGSTMVFNVTVLCLDIVDISKTWKRLTKVDTLVCNNLMNLITILRNSMSGWMFTHV